MLICSARLSSTISKRFRRGLAYSLIWDSAALTPSSYTGSLGGNTTVTAIHGVANFVGLTLNYLVEILTQLAGWSGGSRIGGLIKCLTGIWLMYCTWAVTVNTALGYKLWI